eukprot:10377827-Alexandrium_andersonii.AAC.1
MAKTAGMEARPPPQRPFRALSGPLPDGRRTMGESALTGQLGSPVVWRPSGGGPGSALMGL